MKLKEYITAVLIECSKQSREKVKILFDLNICAQFNHETKEWDILVVSDDTSSSKIKFDVEIEAEPEPSMMREGPDVRPCGCRYVPPGEFGLHTDCTDPIHKDFQL